MQQRNEKIYTVGETSLEGGIDKSTKVCRSDDDEALKKKKKLKEERESPRYD